MGTKEVRCVRHPDDGHVADDLVGSYRRTMAAHRLHDRSPHTTMDNAVPLMMAVIDVDVCNDA
jgi:hypothetical protein